MSKWSLFWEYKSDLAFAYVNGKELVPITILTVVKTTAERKAWRGRGLSGCLREHSAPLLGDSPVVVGAWAACSHPSGSKQSKHPGLKEVPALTPKAYPPETHSLQLGPTSQRFHSRRKPSHRLGTGVQIHMPVGDLTLSKHSNISV